MFVPATLVYHATQNILAVKGDLTASTINKHQCKTPLLDQFNALSLVSVGCQRVLIIHKLKSTADGSYYVSYLSTHGKYVALMPFIFAPVRPNRTTEFV